jgi:hypothetical protein
MAFCYKQVLKLNRNFDKRIKQEVDLNRWGKKSFSYRFAIIAAGLMALIIMSMLGVTGCGDDGTSSTNLPPPSPSDPVPADGAVNTDIGQRLEWLCLDPDDTFLHYALYFGTTDPPPFLDSLETYLYSHDRLEFNTTYYWHVTAVDAAGDTAASPTWSFTTGNFYLIDNWVTQQAWKITVIDGLIYQLEYNKGLRIFDITDTSFVGVRIDSVGMYAVDYPNYGMAIDGDMAFLSKDASFRAIDITNRFEPTLFYTTPEGFFRGTEGVRDIEIIHDGSDRYAVTVSADTSIAGSPVSYLRITDITGNDSLTWAPVDSLQYDGLSIDLEISGDYAFVADSVNGLMVFDISDLTNAALETTMMTNALPIRTFIDGDLAYIADGVAGLTIVNIADPTSPSIIGHVDTPGTARDVCVLETTAFIADYWNGGIQVADVTDPTNPVIIDSHASTGGAAGIYAGYDTYNGDTYPLVYFGDTFMGLYVYEYNLQ